MDKALIARMFGGLGNQMFVYANARAIALRNDARLLLDTRSGFWNDPYRRHWCLHHFNVQYDEVGAAYSFDFPGGKAARKLLREFNRRVSPFNFVLEKNYERFDPAVKNWKLRRTTWAEGYWQSPLYFDDIAEAIRQDFQVKTPLSEAAERVLEQIRQKNAVCLHARRLRNVLSNEVDARIKSLPLDFYQNAVRAIGKRVENPHFFCFADAPEWLEENLRLPYPATFVTFNRGSDEKNYEDFALMKACRHFVISNSTFAWWAAWLGEAPDKIVCAPGLEYWDNLDILPSEWLTLNNFSLRNFYAV